MTPAEFIAFAQARHGPDWLYPMAEETGYSYSQLWYIAHRGRPVGKRLAIIANGLPAKPKRRAKRLAGSVKQPPTEGEGI